MADRNEVLARAKSLLIFVTAAVGFAVLILVIGNWILDDAAGLAPTAHLPH